MHKFEWMNQLDRPEWMSEEEAAGALNLTLLVFGGKAELIDKGLLAGDSPITPGGLEAYQELKSSGYTPDMEEVVHYLMEFENLDKEKAEMIAILLVDQFAGQIPEC